MTYKERWYMKPGIVLVAMLLFVEHIGVCLSFGPDYWDGVVAFAWRLPGMLAGLFRLSAWLFAAVPLFAPLGFVFHGMFLLLEAEDKERQERAQV